MYNIMDEGTAKRQRSYLRSTKPTKHQYIKKHLSFNKEQGPQKKSTELKVAICRKKKLNI